MGNQITVRSKQFWQIHDLRSQLLRSEDSNYPAH
jgi:hypothetical protein